MLHSVPAVLTVLGVEVIRRQAEVGPKLPAEQAVLVRVAQPSAQSRLEYHRH